MRNNLAFEDVPVDMPMDMEGEEDVIYSIYERLRHRMGKERALKEMGLNEPPVKPDDLDSE